MPIFTATAKWVSVGLDKPVRRGSGRMTTLVLPAKPSYPAEFQPVRPNALTSDPGAIGRRIEDPSYRLSGPDERLPLDHVLERRKRAGISRTGITDGRRNVLLFR